MQAKIFAVSKYLKFENTINCLASRQSASYNRFYVKTKIENYMTSKNIAKIGGLAFIVLMYGCHIVPSNNPDAKSSDNSGATRAALATGPSPCIVTPPQSYTNEKSKKISADLTVFGNSVGVDTNIEQKATEVFAEIPDEQIACTMLLQTVACLGNYPNTQATSARLLQIVDSKNSCTSNVQVDASPGQTVYIQTATASQADLARVLKEKFGDRGFSAYGPDLQPNASPNSTQIRIFYQSDFEAAKLVKNIMNRQGIEHVLIAPNYSWKNTSVKRGNIEVWLQK
ncbi:hypothetical protein K8353_31140 [Burkholderia contaminans]|nr:hypothetical protein [Burkholderia contaminans]